jgi:hypothetical protein
LWSKLAWPLTAACVAAAVVLACLDGDRGVVELIREPPGFRFRVLPLHAD